MCRKLFHRMILLGLLLCITPLISITWSQIYEGYTLASSGSSIKLIDWNNKLINSWSAGGTVQTAAYLLEDGSVLFPIGASGCFNGHGAHPQGRLKRLDWNGNILWDYTYCSSNYVGAYDMEPMPNGNVALIVHYNESSGFEGAPGRIVEIKPTGKTTGEKVWECNVTDLIDDAGYLNSISYNPTLDQFAVTIQEPTHTCLIIDHKTGSIVADYSISSGRIHGCSWVMDTYIGSDKKIADIVTSSITPGNIVFVANGLRQFIEINGKTGSVVKTTSYSFSTNQGGVQRLPNGNTLITKGYSSTIDEYGPTGTKVGSVTGSGSSTMRVYKYGRKYPGVGIPEGTNAVNFGIVSHMNNAIKTFYTPATGLTTFRFANNNNQAVVRIFSVTGKEVLIQKTMQSQITVDSRMLAPGAYIVQVELPNRTFTTMFSPIK